MRQDYFVFLNVAEEGLSYFFGLSLNDWWTSLVEQGTEKFWLAGILIGLALILIGGFRFWGLRFLSYCLVGSYLGLILVAGESPSVATMTLAILYVAGTLAAGTGKSFRIAAGSALTVLILSGVLLILSAHVGVPVLKSAFGDVMPLRTKIQQTSLVHVLNQLLPDELKFQDGTGEYEGGSLETQGEGPEFTGRTVITVESEQLPERAIYWARYMGNVYTGYSFNDSGDLDDPENPANIRYPADTLADLQAFCEVNPKDTPQEAMDFVRETLQNRAVYNLHVSPLPEGEDFIEYFFFQTKEGYCIHYAATAVMMLRMYGIPARYVTGFLIPPSLFYLNEAGVYQADVPDDHAHAWAEAYIDGNWVRVETTPPSGIPEDVREVEETGETSESEQAENSTENLTENAGENGTEAITETTGLGTEALENAGAEGGQNGSLSGTQNPDSGSNEVMGVSGEPEDLSNLGPSWVFLPVILILALIIILVGMFIRRMILLGRRQKENVQEIFADIFEVLVIGGLSPELSILSEDLDEKILECFPWINGDELRAVLEIVLRTTYGPSRATDDEWIKVQGLYYMICRHLGKEQKGMARFVFYMVDAWI